MKGILYSTMISLIVIPILALILFYSQSSQIRSIDTDIRANELEYFTQSIELDLIRFVSINGKRALISAVSFVVINGTGLDNAPYRIKEMMENGTLYGETAPLVDTSNMKVWEGEINEIAKDSGFLVELKDSEVQVSQLDSFNLLFEVEVAINISDKMEVMGVVKNVSTAVVVPIEGLEDPTFPLNTYARVIRFIVPSNASKNTHFLVEGVNSSGYVSGETFVVDSTNLVTSYPDKILVTDSVAGKEAIAAGFKGVVSESDTVIPPLLLGKSITGAANARQNVKNNTMVYLDQDTKKVWDLSNLTSDIINGFYYNSTNGASFLDRLEGRTTLSPEYAYGLETFVYLPDLTDASLTINPTASCIDYKYWNGFAGGEIRNGAYNPIYTWFKIDAQSAADYGIGDLL